MISGGDGDRGNFDFGQNFRLTVDVHDSNSSQLDTMAYGQSDNCVFASIAFQQRWAIGLYSIHFTAGDKVIHCKSGLSDP